MSIISDPVVTLVDVGALTVAAGQAAVTFPIAVDVLGVTPSVTVAPVGASATWDINKNGTTIFTTQADRPKILTTATSGAEATPAITRFEVGDVLTVDCDVVGSGTAGTNCTLSIRYRAAADTPTN